MKKLFAMLLMLMLCVGLVTVASAATITESKPAGSGSENDPYQISSAAELYWFANEVNTNDNDANAVLTNNITVNENVLVNGALNEANANSFIAWEPIGHVVNTDNDPAWEIDVYYSGSFDGQGYTISGLYLNDTTRSRQYIGLFGQTKGTIKNVKIADSYFYAKSNVGGVVGYSEGGTIENCTNGATVILPYTGSTVRGGGVVGFNDNGTVKNCTNNGNVQGVDSCIVGGIAGQSIGSAAMIEDCTNNGTISATSNAGGIVGKMGGNSLATPADAGSVKDCTNTGNVTGITYNIGGIVGAAETKTTPGEISGCVNEGKVTATGSSSVVGGIIGYNQGVSVSECSNKGTIEAKKYVGGIVGQHRVGYGITACGNFGDIVCSSNSYAGGIVGEVIRTTSSLTVSKCYNTGTVDGSGIIGYSGGTFTSGSENSRIIVKNCYNTGTVDVGGIIGSASCTDVESCYNAGSSVAAIIRSIIKDSSVANCYYLNTSATNSTHGGTSLTKEEMTDNAAWISNYSRFDTTVWSKQTNSNGKLYLPKLDSYSPYLEGVATPAYTVTLPTTGTGYTIAAVEGSSSPVDEGGSYSFTVTINDGYRKGSGFAVKANDTVLTEKNGKYTISSINENQIVTVDDVEKIPSYTVNVSATPAEGGTVTGGGSYEEGASVTMTATANEGYQFAGWTTTTEGVTFANASAATTTFTMPAGNVTVNATFKRVYNVFIAQNIQNGKLEADKYVAAAGETVTLKATPDTDYVKGQYTTTLHGEGAIGLSGDTFTMPACDVTVSVTFLPINTHTVWKTSQSGLTVSSSSHPNDKVPDGETYTFTVDIWEGYEKTATYNVTVNDKAVMPNDNGVYTVSGVSADLNIKVVGVFPCRPDAVEDFKAGSNYPFALVCEEETAHTYTAPYYNSNYITNVSAVYGNVNNADGWRCDVTFDVDAYLAQECSGHRATGAPPATATFTAKWDTSKKKWSYVNEATEYTVTCAPETYVVTVNSGVGMTKTTESGNAQQTVNAGSAIQDVVYTADSGYYFPESYGVEAVNGVSVIRNSAAQITVSGTPTGNAALTLPAATAQGKEATPSAVFTATGDSTGTLSNLNTATHYKVGDGEWMAVNASEINLSGMQPCSIYVYKQGNGTSTLGSDVQTITVTKAAAPSGVTVTGCTTADNSDGKLLGVTADMEYRKSDAAAWMAGTGSDITGLIPGDYYVRAKASGTVLASDYVTLSVGSYVAPTLTKIEVTTQPKLDYSEGDALDLSAMKVTATWSDGSTTELGYADVTASVANGTLLTKSAHKGAVITVTYNGQTAQTNALNVKSGNAGVSAVTVKGAAGTIDGNTVSVVLPYGNHLADLTSADFAITLADSAANVSAQPASNDGGATWLFTVTAENGAAQVYTVNVSIGADPDAPDKTDVSNIKLAIGSHNWTVAQETANTSEAVKAWIETTLANSNLNGVTTSDVVITAITPAVAGDMYNLPGTNGSFSFTVKLSKGNVTDTVEITTGVITATTYSGNAFVPVTDITGVPTAATAGTPLTLTGAVKPGNATYTTIVWSVKAAGNTGASISGNALTATAAGDVLVTATIANGKSATEAFTKDFVITVNPAPVVLTGIAIAAPPAKTVYTEGESFDPSGMVVTATYSDGTTKAVTGYTIAPTGALATTDTAVTVSYTENGVAKTATQAIEVNAKPVVLESIAVTTAPAKTVYTEGESFDPSGMVVTATYSDGTSKAVTGYTIAPTGALATTDTAVTVSYTENGVAKTATQAIEVNAKPVVLESIAVTTAPAKTVYTEGESFNPSGMVVTATYSDGTSKAVTGYSIAPTGALAITDAVVTVSYTENGVAKTATQAIAVNAKTFTVIFDANGGSGTMQPQVFTAGVAQNLTLHTYQRDGFEFNGWNTAADGSGISFADGASVTASANATLYAQWQKNAATVYTVTVSNDGNGTGSAAPSSGVTGTEVELTATPNSGYRFKEWQVVAGGATITDNKLMIGTADVEVKAIFELIPAVTHTVSFNPNGGSGTMALQVFTAGAAQKLTLNTFTREGFAFNGWNTAADGSGNAFADGASVTASSDVILYAQWKAVPAITPLVIARQPADQLVVEGQRAEFSVEAIGDGLTYQWYINRNDGRGWKVLDGAIGTAYVTSITDLECDGFRYGCLIADQHGNTLKSDAAMLRVSKVVVLPETGDSSNPMLWLAMIILSMAAILLLRKKEYSR